MDIQEVFYYTATFAMLLAILFFLGMIALLFYLKKKLTDLNSYGKSVISKIDMLVDEMKEKLSMLTSLRTTIFGRRPK